MVGGGGYFFNFGENHTPFKIKKHREKQNKKRHMTKLTKKLFEIKDYQSTRNSNKCQDDFMITITTNLLTNLANRNNFIHKELNFYKSQKKKLDINLKLAIGLYVCSLITCWETFFRDLFIFLCNTDQNINNNLKKCLTEDIPLNLTIGEFEARKYNFQNLNQTREAFDYIFQQNTTKLSDYFTTEVFEGILNKDYSLIFKWIQEGSFKAKVDVILDKGFEIRHKVTHDANFLIDFDSKLLSEIECVFQTIPQFFIASFAKRYSQKRIVFNLKEHYVRITNSPTKDEKNYVFNVKDFMADDYTITK